MKVKIDARHFDLTEAIKEYVTNKCEQLKTQLKDVIEAHYILNVENHPSTKDGHIAELILHVSGESIMAKIDTDDLYKSIDQVTSKVLKLAHKHKDKAKSK